jgi:hypothetical protein
VPVFVDGATGAITLGFAPKAGSVVKVSYYHNTFRDNFDFIPSRDVVSVDLVSLIPGGGGASSNYLNGVDWVLRDDKIYWGTSALASAGENQLGNVSFGSSQISPVLKDERSFLLECSAVVDTTVVPPRTSDISFKLPHQATDGTGSAIATSNPNLITARVGVSISDALGKDPVKVVRVNPADSTIVLAQPVPVGQKVFATFYYNNIQDEIAVAGEGYTLTVNSQGGSNQGTYTISNSGKSLFAPSYTAKGSDLTTTFVVFPSGSEALSDIRIESGVPVEETVSVQIENFEPTPAIFTSHGSAPYSIIDGNSDTITVGVDGTNGNNLKTVDLSAPLGGGRSGFFTKLVSDPLPYTASSDNAHLGTITGDLVLKIDGEEISVAFAGVNNATVADVVTTINTASLTVAPKYHCMSPIGNVTIVAGSYDDLTLSYTGDATASTSIEITIDPDTYTPDELATEISTKLTASIGNIVALAGLSITCSVVNGRLVFELTSIANADTSYGYLEFVADANAVEDFASLAGIDTSANAGETQTKFGFLPVATSESTSLSANALRDRLILRNRTLIGNDYHPPVQIGVQILGGDLLRQFGLFNVEPLNISPRKAVVDPASILIKAGWLGLQVNASSEPAVKFYDGSGDFPVNNVLRLNISGVAQEITFVGSAEGTVTGIITTLDTKLNSLSNVSVTHEGVHLRITDASDVLDSYIEVLDGSANTTLGLTEGQILTSNLVSSLAVVSALQNHQSTTLSEVLFDSNTEASQYVSNAVSYVYTNATGSDFVVFESLNTGVSSFIDFSGGNAITTIGNGLKITTADGAVGEDSYQGFFVTSTNSSGTGSANTSTLNDGAGVDGVIGQTYVDSVTGLSFTILQRDGNQPYPTGANATLTFKVSKTLTCNANIPVNVIPGVQLFVANTIGSEIGDTALVETFNKSGAEPSIGTLYYMNLTRKKSVFGTSVFTRLSEVISAFGEVGAENPLSLGAYLAFLNGANAIALHQIPLAEGSTSLTSSQVATALVDVEGEIANGLLPSIIVPLVPADEILLAEISRHCDVQSSLRYRAERTAILGCQAGTVPEQAGRLANLTRNARVRLVYPDIASLTFTNTQGTSQNLIVDGRYLAVAVACATTASTIDPATPWTNRVLVGFDSLLRTLDAVDANQTANLGVSILQPQGANLRIRHGLTTNMSGILTKTPTVVQIADEVHLRARNLLDGYIGQKYLSTIIGQIEGRVNMMFKDLVKEQIIDSYTGLAVTRDPQDPTGLLVEVFYKPVFPLLYIQFTFNIRSTDQG